jgi:ABC-type Mn2+/Zn2+ transport system ATPase subunit
MSDVAIKISNCNNIESGEIPISQDKLNIFFGRNGTGKSTLAKAIELASQGKELTELLPFGLRNEDANPLVEGISSGNVAIFDDDYVRKYVYQPETLFKDTFNVLIRSDEYDQAKRNIDEALSRIRTTVTGRQEIINLKAYVEILLNAIKLTGGNRIARRGGAKGLLEGKGAYFNPPEELEELKPFFEEDTVTKWAAWRLQGYEQYGSKGCCPYCSNGDTEKTEIMNRVFSESFDKSSVEIAAAIVKALEALEQYINKEKVNVLVSLFGIKDDVNALETQLIKLRAEAAYLFEKLEAVVSFNGASVDRENIGNLEVNLSEMKVDLRVLDTFFVTELLEHEMGAINNEIDSLLEKVGALKREIGKYNKYIRDKVKDRKQDINDFLSIAGFKYLFNVEIKGEEDAKASLKFIMPDGSEGENQSLGNHLSWGEKHAFALVLFMFDAISRNAELIVLDDPISSFDHNKKYAIINRLFKTGDRDNSLYQRTVLMLTHDFEPVIDYIQVGGRQDPSAVCATYLENVAGQLQCTPIEKNTDLMSSVVLLKELVLDTNIDIAARVGCLRKFIEHQNRNPRDESVAYNILSSLIHGRQKPTYDNAGVDEIEDEQLINGSAFIKEYITEFDYETILEQCSPQNLMERYSSEPSTYIKMLILRAYTEQSNEARERLRQTNDVLRKYVDETYHIENDYLYSLDVRRFNIVPQHYIDDAERYVANEKARFDFV